MDARGAVGVSERNGVPCRREDNKPVINKLVRYSVVMFTFPIAVFYAAYHVFLGVSLLCHLLRPLRAIGRAQGRAQAAAYVYRHLMLAASSCRHARPSMKDHDDRVTYSGVLAVLAGTSVPLRSVRVHAPHTHATPSRARPPARPPTRPSETRKASSHSPAVRPAPLIRASAHPILPPPTPSETVHGRPLFTSRRICAAVISVQAAYVVSAFAEKDDEPVRFSPQDLPPLKPSAEKKLE
jgi:hypothetical protein